MTPDPNAETQFVRNRLIHAGWSDTNPTSSRPSGSVSPGASVLVLEWPTPDGGRLRVDYRPDEAALHLRVADPSAGVDFVFRYESGPAALLDALVALQDELRAGSVHEQIGPLLAVCYEAYVLRNGQRVRLSHDHTAP